MMTQHSTASHSMMTQHGTAQRIVVQAGLTMPAAPGAQQADLEQLQQIRLEGSVIGHRGKVLFGF
jgi:hypothetical protein